MDLAGQFVNHIKSIGYTEEIGVNDISQVCQGVMKPIIQFLMSHTTSKTKSKHIRGNLALNTRQLWKKPGEFHSVAIEKLLERAISNHITLKKLNEKSNQRSAHKIILQTYVKKIENLRKTIRNYRETLAKVFKAPEFTQINKELLGQISENLLYIHSELKSTDLSPAAIEGLASTFATNLSPISIYPHIIEKAEKFKQQLLEKIRSFNPESEFLSLGVNLRKNNDLFEVEHIDNNTLIDKFRKDVNEKREVVWMQFYKTEEILVEIEVLKNKLQGLLKSYQFADQITKDFFISEITKQGKKAQLETLEQTHKELELKKAEKESQSMLFSQHKSLAYSESLISKISPHIARHSQIRRETLRKKLQIEEFIKKHLLNLRTTLPELLKPMNTGISRELSEYFKVCSMLLPCNIPNFSENTGEDTEDLFKKQALTARLLKICKALGVSAFTKPENAKAAIKNYSEHTESLQTEGKVQNFVCDLSKINKSNNKQHISTLKEELKKTRKEIESLDEDFEIWKAQPAQYLIPWRKDHFELNISEALELWKTSTR